MSGQVRQAVEQYKSGALSSTTTPNVQSHFGMGMGGGRGMGMGRGIGASTLAGPGQPEPIALSEEKSLKNQVNEWRKQIKILQSRINALEKK